MNSQRNIQPQLQYLAVYQVYHPDFQDLQLFGGQHPSSLDKKGRAILFDEFIQLGITASICLLEAHELQRFFSYKDKFLEKTPNAQWLHYPIVDMSIPSPELMTQILDRIDTLVAANEKIYVHCLGGHGRTGTVIGCWLKRQGYHNQEIYLKLAQWRVKTLFGTTASPQRAEQIFMINHWQKEQ